MSDTPIIPNIAGVRLRSVEKKDYSWFFFFTDRVGVTTESHWRFINDNRVLVTAEDHGEKFGHGIPVDASRCVLAAVQDTPIQFVHIDHATGDLFVYFSNKTFLQFLQMSGGHEAWSLGMDGSRFICTGGGEIAAFNGK